MRSRGAAAVDRFAAPGRFSALTELAFEGRDVGAFRGLARALPALGGRLVRLEVEPYTTTDLDAVKAVVASLRALTGLTHLRFGLEHAANWGRRVPDLTWQQGIFAAAAWMSRLEALLLMDVALGKAAALAVYQLMSGVCWPRLRVGSKPL
ncbi:hypothetical protein MNEG_0848 [Monoraphidium neglectum]|uniref:Uncharacterized protein n=1 Tax=Monoraphidium neglectum TaxID=145388 RepID=A0A0D2MX96_9CHLO|nr:hypothetical protein MNEG_0848 [Monoraphidium neglectum]KIZ07110.1 hypothetical protein MNEG_0848 [Monoraphidium neglectum]|eukprot:XP_013906129.1 hypothetical protein MNEG_0848 [Monoraphidium neglectum]